MKERRGGKLSVIGSGISGIGAARLGRARGYEVFLSEGGTISEERRRVLQAEGIVFEDGGHTPSKVYDADWIVKSPGIPQTEDIIAKARERDIPILSEIDWAARHTKAQLVGVTGSNGKTTTTSLIHHILQVAGRNAGVAGNIGTSFAGMVVEDQCDTYVLELSSFQLEDIGTLHLDIAVLLNITPDHLDRYNKDIREYAAAKYNIVKNQTGKDLFIFNAEDPLISELRASKPELSAPHPFYPTTNPTVIADGAYADLQDVLHATVKGQTLSVPFRASGLRGKHNRMNVMAALLVAGALGVSESLVEEALKTFVLPDHRLQLVRTVGGVEFINDSKATNVDSVYYALESMGRPIVLIAGGVDKGNDYSQIAALVREKVKCIVTLGPTNERLIDACRALVPKICHASSMREAVALAASEATAGDSVLLSPACASFDLFRDYVDRGQQFRMEVEALQIPDAFAASPDTDCPVT